MTNLAKYFQQAGSFDIWSLLGLVALIFLLLLFKTHKKISYKKFARFKSGDSRSFLRQPIELGLEYSLISKTDNTTETFETAHFKELSGGGCSFYTDFTDQEFKIDDELLISFTPPDKETIKTKAKVKRIRKIRSYPKAKYIISLEFIDLNEKIRQNIIQHIYEEQINAKQMQKNNHPH